ncbi:MAG: hypothetical protein ACPHL6_07450, partial [Rubripirellula sp.]
MGFRATAVGVCHRVLRGGPSPKPQHETPGGCVERITQKFRPERSGRLITPKRIRNQGLSQDVHL